MQADRESFDVTVKLQVHRIFSIKLTQAPHLQALNHPSRSLSSMLPDAWPADACVLLLLVARGTG